MLAKIDMTTMQSFQVAGRFDEDLIEHRFCSQLTAPLLIFPTSLIFSLSNDTKEISNYQILSSIFLPDNWIIHSRRIELQSFTDRICRHPVLAGSEVPSVFPFYQNFQVSFVLCSFQVQSFFLFLPIFLLLLSRAHLKRSRCGNILCQRRMRRSGQRWPS